VFPVYAGRTLSRIALRVGLFTYDLLARTPRVQRHQVLSAALISEMEPELAREGLRGGAFYYDGHGDDSRLTLENALDAAIHGAAAVNYVALTSLEKQAGKIRAAQVRDIFSGDQFAIRARILVNASGPWVDAVRRMEDPGAASTVRLTKGVHLVLKAERLPVHHSLVLSDGHGRIIFLIRDRDVILLGTTDTDYSGEPERVRADAADIDYLLEVVARSIPSAALTHHDIITSFAGLRSLVGGKGGTAPSRLPREELVMVSKSGMLSIAGGKLTTHRRIAQRVVDLVCRELGKAAGRSPTLTTPLPGARRASQKNPLTATITASARAQLAARYGSRIGLLGRLIEQNPRLAEPLGPQCAVLAAEAIQAARFEMACTLEDFMMRRTALGLRAPDQAEAVAQRAACLMGAELGWTNERTATEVAEFVAGLKSRREF
jgi:glycerol-3-phosphate dehydrogenase